MNKSESITNLAKALIEFHRQVGIVKKSETNPFFKSKYADLSTILDAIKQPLESAKLTFSQFPTGENELTTILMHESGEYLQDTFKMTPVKNDPQGAGSVITYQRRYALGAILGLNIDEDDDGNAASQAKSAAKPQTSHAATMQTARQQVKAESSLITLKKKLKDAGATDEAKALEILEKSTGVKFKSIAEVKEDTAKELLGLWMLQKGE